MSEPLEQTPRASSPAPQPQRVIESDSLFRGTREVLITHNEQVYRLRITRSGKLILQK